ncbi:magnesium transporter CorA family protein [Candidatus Uhrbacteria bacterium]|nr:magnesium transporter CorA family protein [Candidatus Uhrbacteria bacterium]
MTQKRIEMKENVWLHISKIKEEDFEYLQQNFKFHHLDYDDIRAKTTLSKIDSYKHYLFFTFHIPVWISKSPRVVENELFIFLDQGNVVTLTREPIKAIDEFFEKLEKNQKFRANILAKGSAFLMYRILMVAFQQTSQIISELTHEFAKLEDEISSRHDKKLTVDLGRTRRNILFLRHIIGPQKNIIVSLIEIERPFLPKDYTVYFDDLRDLLDTVWSTSDNLKLLVDGLFDVNEALLSHKTNDVITVLTIISASLMVPTLIAGFYGMNVPWLPFAHSANFVSLIFLTSFILMLLIVTLIIRRPRS